MDWQRSRAVAPRFEFVTQAASTNDDLRDAATGADAASWPHGSVLVTDDQTAGRGRLGRTWLAPTGKTLAISVLLRPEVGTLSSNALGWIPLVAGAAMTYAVQRAVARGLAAAYDEVRAAALAAGGDVPDDVPDDERGLVEVELKWPNDVLISGYKVCGILSELLPDSHGIIVGSGLNLTLDEHDLPTLTSTSLQLATGHRPDADAVLADYLERLHELVGALTAHHGDAHASGVAGSVAELCGTLGTEVRVELPGEHQLHGVADSLDDDGRLVVIEHENGERQSVAAGDVTHLRY